MSCISIVPYRFVRDLLIAIVLFTYGAGSYASAKEHTIDFNRDIRPILSENCFYCHGQDENKRQADLRLDDRQSALDVGAIIPGDAESSSLIDRINSHDPDTLMPPPDSHRQLSSEQKEILQRWIEAGALYEKHWAFIPPVRPNVPTILDHSWARNPIDHFVLAQLEAFGLQPSQEADRTTLIKRLSIDLTGLPPTPEEVDAFVTDPDPQAYERLVQRLLNSEHYGERMALPWLDAARYADSNGFQQDGDTYQYVWRDWVVQALNDDMPFDTFTTQQLAGDLLPDATLDQKIASAFNRNHMLNGEGGAIAEEQRNVILFDRVDVTSTVWLGLTMACAQCHDHKYDPLTMTDYYGFFAFFNNVPEAGVPKNRFGIYRLDNPWVFAPNDDQQQRLDAFDTLITQTEKVVQERLASSAFKAAMKAWETKIVEGSQPTLQWTTWHSINGFASPSYDAAFDEPFGPENGVDLHASFDEGKRTWQAQAEWNDGVVHNWDAANNETIYLFREVTSDRPVHLNVSLGSDDGIRVWLNNKFIKEERAKRAAAADQLFVNLPLDKGNNRLLIKIINASGSAGFYFRPNMKVIPDDVLAVLKIDTSVRTAAQQAKAHDYFLDHAAPSDVTALVHKVKNQKKDRTSFENTLPRVMIMSDASTRKTHILNRGNYMDPGDEVTSGTPAVFMPMTDEMPRNRLGLAEWLLMPENPLTSRVQVNRMWQYFFGIGLVKTAEDLGVQSEYPRHKDLLDWLAVEFRENGWSMKSMHRLIVTSATYRQSSKTPKVLRERDQENRLFARASRFRMPAPILRDWALQSSGLLVRRIGGKPVYPYQPDEVWESLAITKERDFSYPASAGEELYRRSLYTFWRRTVGPTNMFDASNRQACRVRQSITSTPLHALTTLNDPTWVEAARVLAEHCLKRHQSLDAQLTDAFRRVVCRLPTPNDLEIMQRAFRHQLDLYRPDPEAAKVFISIGNAPRDESLNILEHAAMAAVCLGIMNLDEALTRE
ncbi:MAG: PSD1 and planctomycete cytochrome C domain-containing protein [Pirellulales bacterium]